MRLIFLIFMISFVSFSYASINDRSLELKLHTLNWKTNWSKHSIAYSELLSGGPKRDGIPPIDKPKFTNINDGAYTVYNNNLDGMKLKGKELIPIVHADHFWFSWAVF